MIDRNWGPAIVTDLVRLIGCKTMFADIDVAASRVAHIELRRYPEIGGPSSVGGNKDVNLPVDLDRVAIYATTSGTTDNPKCVAITHRQIRSAYRACLSAHDFSLVAHCACLFEVNSLGVLGSAFCCNASLEPVRHSIRPLA